MIINDFIYFSSLILCISLGSYYKEIDKVDMKRNYGAGLGLLVIFLVCGYYTVHTFLMVYGNVLIIKSCDRHYVHQISLAYTWTYLMYLHHYFSNHSYMISVFKMMALRLVGLACELSIVDKPKSNYRDATPANADEVPSIPEAVDILSYAYYFIGLHRGPYYRWRIYKDHLNTPLSMLGDCRIITEEKLKKAALCAVAYFVFRSGFNTEMYEAKKFYSHTGMDFRYLSNIPLLLMFYLYLEMIALLSAAVCTETGFGIYPVQCEPQPGHGPSTHYSVINLISKTPETASEQEYNINVLNSFEIEKLILGPKMKDTMRGWDMSVRYWYWEFASKKFIKANKEVRSAFAFLLWTLWCGLSIPQIIISTTLWLCIHLEYEYSALYDTDGSMKLPWDIGFSIMRMFCLLYLTPCFVVDDTSVVLKYYNSIYWMFHIILLLLIVIAVIIFKSRS